MADAGFPRQPGRRGLNGALLGLISGAALIAGSQGALAATCAFPLTLASGSTCADLIVPVGQTGNIDNRGSITAATTAVTVYGTVSTLNNSGAITSNQTIDGSEGVISYYGNIGSIVNSGVITGYNHGIRNYGTLGTIDNTGTIVSLADTAAGNDAILGTLTNEASGTLNGYQNGYWNNRQITNVVNYGSIIGQTVTGFVNATDVSIVNQANPLGGNYVTSLKNFGSIVGGIDGIDNYSTFGAITNYAGGTISGADTGIYNSGVTNSSIGSLVNSGAISASSVAHGYGYGIMNDTGATITSITNLGSITGAAFGIYNVAGSIGTLTNGQGGNSSSAATTALTYTGNVPTNYFLYVASSTHYGQIAFISPTGSMAFGLDAGSTLASGAYAKVLSGIGASSLTGARTGTLGAYAWTLSLESGSLTVWDLLVAGGSSGPSAVNTRAALASNAAALRGELALRASVVSGALAYDCESFDARGACLSFQARSTSSGSMGQGAGLLLGAYRVAPHLRIGGFIDASASWQDPQGLKSSDPLPTFGGFVAYGDATGLQARAAVAGNAGAITITRSANLAATEAGSGKATLTTYGVMGELGWGFALGGATVAAPYAGFRLTDSRRGAYSEALTPGSVDYPLSYSAMSQRVTTTSAGVRLRSMFTDKLGGQLGLGADYDVASAESAYAGASAISGLGTFALPGAGGANRLRPVATAGLAYQIDRTQSVATSVSLRGQAYSRQPVASLLAGYQLAF